MKKLINWTCGSFFRTLGRFAFYILIGYILSCLINLKEIKLPSLWDVYAETITPNYIEINDTQFNGYSYIGNSTNNSNVSLNVYLSESLDKIDIPYLVVDLCVLSEPYVDRSHSVGNACANSCFSNLVQKQKIAGSCKTNGQTGQIWRVNTPIVKWSLGTQIATLDDTFYVSIPKSGNNYISVYGVYLSDDSNYNETINYTQNFNNVINNQNQNTQDIMNNQNQNTQDIMNNQNQNLNTICKNILEMSENNSNSCGVSVSTDDNGTYILNGTATCTRYVNFATEYVYGSYQINNITSTATQVLNNKILSVSISNGKTNVGHNTSNGIWSFVIINGITYNNAKLNISLEDGNRFSGRYCKKGSQINKIDDINNSLTDESGPNISGLGNSAGWLPAGPVDSILNLPLSFLTNLNNNLSRTCEPVNLPLPYVNKTLPLPCLNSVYNEIDGLPNWLNTIGIIASAFILFGYFINLYKYIDDTLTFRENNYIDNWSGV